jgi:hypothetical protein
MVLAWSNLRLFAGIKPNLLTFIIDCIGYLSEDYIRHEKLRKRVTTIGQQKNHHHHSLSAGCAVAQPMSCEWKTFRSELAFSVSFSRALDFSMHHSRSSFRFASQSSDSSLIVSCPPARPARKRTKTIQGGQ